MTFFWYFLGKNGGFWGCKLKGRWYTPRLVYYHLNWAQITPKKTFFCEKEGLKG